jgi:hypothetical protein
MLKRYIKQGASAWDRKLTLVLGFLFGITLLLFAVYAVTLFSNWAEVDDCLDKGGSYDYELGRCDFDVNQPSPKSRNGA